MPLQSLNSKSIEFSDDSQCWNQIDHMDHFQDRHLVSEAKQANLEDMKKKKKIVFGKKYYNTYIVILSVELVFANI